MDLKTLDSTVCFFCMPELQLPLGGKALLRTYIRELYNVKNFM
jgi:hypothetical protein